ncbi:hypothetical protein GFS31_24880 [Leptolyngbya sp. BL0902]|nr:hypothetical protein GFS31_24880 [Leptolyngbya sp. BL0902]
MLPLISALPVVLVAVPLAAVANPTPPPPDLLLTATSMAQTTGVPAQIADPSTFFFLVAQAENPAADPAANGTEDPGNPAASETEAFGDPGASSVDLRVRPRVGAGYSTDGGGYPSLGRFEAFVPVWQTVGEAVSFLEGRIVVNSDDTVAGGAALGYRGYSPTADRIRGGYLGFDLRGTSGGTFSQLGTGYESLGRNWDFRINGYLPVGDRERTLRDETIDVGFQASTRFQGNLLLLETERQRLRLLDQESALGGFDAEAGTRLAGWETGDLKGFGGVYLQGAPSLGSYLGWRLRLAADITPNFNSGLALQGDGLFGTRLVFSVGATFPGIRPAGEIPDADQVRARLGEPTARQPEIAVQITSEREELVERASQALQNPEREEDYRFQHVVLGRSGGDGTFENPFGTVQDALDATVSDGNDVVYVDGATDVLIPALTIPDQVQLLSQGPRQQLAGLPFSGFEITPTRLPFSATVNYVDGIVVELPFSGDGNFPRMDGATLGNRTVLAGFRFEDVAGNAVVGNGVSNVELRNNTITNPGQRGIFLNDVGGSVILFDNVANGARGTAADSGQGILIRNTTTLNAANITIAGFQANRNRVGMELAAIGSLTPREAPNQIIIVGPSNPNNTSIGLSPGTTITNSLSNNREGGLRIVAADLGGQEVIVEGTTISNNGGDGVTVLGGTPGGSLISFQEVDIRDGVISNNRGNGLRIQANESATQEFNLDRNQITNNDGAGLISVANDLALQEFVLKTDLGSLGIGENLISGNGGPGLSFTTTNAETLLIELSQNQFENNDNGGLDIEVTADNTARVCFIAATNTGSPTIQLNNNTVGEFQVGDLPNLSANNDGASVNLNLVAPPPATFTNINRQVCL